MLGNIITFAIIFIIWRHFRVKDAMMGKGAFVDPDKAPGVASTLIAFAICCIGTWVAVFGSIYACAAINVIIAAPCIAFPAMWLVFQGTRVIPQIAKEADGKAVALLGAGKVQAFLGAGAPVEEQPVIAKPKQKLFASGENGIIRRK